VNADLAQTLVVAAAVGLASGAMGAFVVLRRMALVGDALSHVALPGLAAALLYGFDPFWGVLACLVAGSVLVWSLEGATRLPTESLVGVLFTGSLALGTLLVPGEDLADALFGAFPELSPAQLAALLSLAAATTCVSFAAARAFVLRSLSPELAQASGVGRGADLLLLLNFALVVAVGIKLVGTLLMGALTIIPAAIAKNLCTSVAGYVLTAAALGLVCASSGALVAGRFALLPGPTIVFLGVGIFLASLPWAIRAR
jgi:zinc transport system permease protein